MEEILKNLMEEICNNLEDGKYWDNPDDELDCFTADLSFQPLTLTSTPNKEQTADDTGNDSFNNKAATDSGLGPSGNFSETGTQSKKSARKNIETKQFEIFRQERNKADISELAEIVDKLALRYGTDSKTHDAALEVFTKDPEAEAVMGTLPPILPKGFLNSINPKCKEWKPSHPKWFDKEDPGYFHCH